MMKMVILAVLVFSLAGVSNCYAIDDDKKLHFGMSVPLGILGGAVIESCCSQWPWYYKLPAATAIGLIPGAFKEAIDASAGGTGWDNKDLLADALGSATGAGIVIIWRF